MYRIHPYQWPYWRSHSGLYSNAVPSYSLENGNVLFKINGFVAHLYLVDRYSPISPMCWFSFRPFKIRPPSYLVFVLESSMWCRATSLGSLGSYNSQLGRNKMRALFFRKPWPLDISTTMWPAHVSIQYTFACTIRSRFLIFVDICVKHCVALAFDFRRTMPGG